MGDGQFINPGDLTVDGLDNVYVGDFGENSRIQKFDSEGNLLTKWGTPGTGDGQFINPAGLAADPSNNIYVVDGGNSRVQKFDSEGNFITKWGSRGSGEGEFIILSVSP